MKKISFLLTVFICTISFCIHPFAADNAPIIVTINNTDVFFDEHSTLSFDEMQSIAEHIVNGKGNIETYGLICNIFGHKNSTEYVTTITHCASSTSPRCLEEEWEIITCSRCGNTESTRLSFFMITCCPEV